MTAEQNPPRVISDRYDSLAAVLDKIGLTRTHKLIILLVAFGALFDAIEQFNIGYAGPVLQKLWGLSGAEVGLLSTATFGGLTIGCLIAGVAGDLYGRKVTYMYNLALYTSGALVCAFAPNLTVLLIGRFLVGIGLGGELNTGVTLVSELVPTKNRGSSVAVVNIAAGGFGIFASAALAWLILGPWGETFGGEAVSWRYLLGVLALPAVLVFVYRRYLPESPRYLLSKGHVRGANTVLTHLASGRLDGRGLTTVDYLDAPEGETIPGEKLRLSEIFRGELSRRTITLWTASWMTFGAQVCINVFMPTVLVAQGYEIVKSIGFSMVINVGGMIGAFAASVFGHYVRRRIVLGYGALAACVVAFAFAYSSGLALILLVGAVLQLMFMVLNTTAWIWAPELYPTRVRAFGTGAAVTVAQLSGTITPLLGGVLFDAYGKEGIFVLVALMYVVMAVAVFFGRETFGKSLEANSEHLSAEPRTDG
jgi:MFS family permease